MKKHARHKKSCGCDNTATQYSTWLRLSPNPTRKKEKKRHRHHDWAPFTQSFFSFSFCPHHIQYDRSVISYTLFAFFYPFKFKVNFSFNFFFSFAWYIQNSLRRVPPRCLRICVFPFRFYSRSIYVYSVCLWAAIDNLMTVNRIYFYVGLWIKYQTRNAPITFMTRLNPIEMNKE